MASKPKSPIKVDRDQLSDALKTVEPLADARADERWRSAVKLESKAKNLDVRAQNNNTEATVSLAASAGVISSAVPHRAFRKSVDAFAPGSIELTSEDDKLLAAREHRTLSLSQTDSDQFPDRLDVGEVLQAALELKGDELAEALDLTGRCASVDETRPSLNSVALDSVDGKLVMVGTNSYHLTMIELDVKNDVQLTEPLLVHLSTAKSIARDLKTRKIETAELQLHSDGVAVEYDKVNWRSRRLLGSFPSWRHLLPEQGFELTLDREELSSALKAIKAVASGNAPVRLQLGSEVVLHYRSLDVGDLEEKMPKSEWDGNPLTVGFSHEYLTDLLKTVQGDSLKGLVTDQTRPAYFSSPGRGYLVMPVRSNEITADDIIVDAAGEKV